MTAEGEVYKEIFNTINNYKWCFCHQPEKNDSGCNLNVTAPMKGYRLRPRYRPGWSTPWIKDGNYHSYADHLKVRIAIQMVPTHVWRCWIVSGIFMDATRINDDLTVITKRLWKSTNAREIELNNLLRSEPHISDPMDHCGPHLEILEALGYENCFYSLCPFCPPFMILNWWLWRKFGFYEELLEVQFFHSRNCFLRFNFGEVVIFLHKHGIAHRSCCFRTKSIYADYNLFSGIFIKGTLWWTPVNYIWMDFIRLISTKATI